MKPPLRDRPATALVAAAIPCAHGAMRRLVLLALLLATPVAAEVDRFTRSNLLATLYHEVAHALVDLLDLPILGLEEDAADALSVHLIDLLHPEMEARAMVRDVAYLYGFEHEERDGDFPYWSRYSTDARRGFNALCLFYGGDPGARAGFARKAELPEGRQETCPEERGRQKAGWDAVMARVPGPGATLRLRRRKHPLEPVLADGIDRLNTVMALPRPVNVRIAPCEEANAFYETGSDTILICAELVDHIRARRPQ
ncbi:MAG: DUF4344 domain-containing metallopeptidase [Pseudomonadota bacterium]